MMLGAKKLHSTTLLCGRNKKNKNLKILYPSTKMFLRQSACSKTAALVYSWPDISVIFSS